MGEVGCGVSDEKAAGKSFGRLFGRYPRQHTSHNGAECCDYFQFSSPVTTPNTTNFGPCMKNSS